MKKHSILAQKIFALSALAALIISFQNCTPFSPAENSPTLSRRPNFNFADMNQAPLIPATDKNDVSCMTKTEYDSCIFYKNPVSQGETPISGSIVAASYDTKQVYGVKLTGLSSTGRLQNSTLRIETLKGALVSTSDKAILKSKAQNDVGRAFSQIATYYWLNRATEYLSKRTGVFPASGKNIRVVVDDTIAGWSPRTNSIHLKINDAGTPMAWSPELALHFLGLANLHHATDGGIEPPSPNKHRSCGLNDGGCCSSSRGCSRAIASGVGDYFVAVMFPNQTKIGETWVNSLDGLQSCGLNRSVDLAAKRTTSTAYNACVPTSRPGEVATMGTIYASMWWEVRKAAAKKDPAKGEIEIDTLFMNHLYSLDGGDDFVTALAKIRSLDQLAFGSRYTPIFEAEFTSRGL